MINLAPRARLEDNCFTCSKPLNAIGDKGIKFPSYDNILHAFGASCKKNTPRPSSTNNLSFSVPNSLSCNRVSLRCDEKEAYANTMETKSLLKLQENVLQQFSRTKEDRRFEDKDNNPRQRIDKLQHFIATNLAGKVPPNHNTDLDGMVESDEEFAKFLVMMPTQKQNGHYGFPAGADSEPNHAPRSEITITSSDEFESKGQKDGHALESMSSYSPQIKSEQPLKSILLAPKYSSQNVFSVQNYSSNDLICGGAEQESKKTVRIRSDSSVQFTAPTVHFISREQQHSGWYTREDEIKMIRRLQRSKQKRLEKKLRKRELANRSISPSCAQNEEFAEGES